MKIFSFITILLFLSVTAQAGDTSYTVGTKQELLDQFQSCHDQGQPDGCITPGNMRNIIGSIQPLVGYIVPTEYGCVGDGSTDDTLCMQDAIDAAESSGLVLRLDSFHKYRITAGLLINNRQLTILGSGGGDGQYVATCRGGLVQGVADLTLITATVPVSIHNICIEGGQVDSVSGAAISIIGPANSSVVRDNQINGTCVGIEFTGTPVGQSADVMIENNLIVPANHPTCAGIRIGTQSTLGNTVDSKVVHNKIYCGGGGGTQIGIEIRDSGGLFSDNIPPYACGIGTKIAPGFVGSLSQVVEFSFFKGGLGDTSTSNDFLISPSSGGSVWNNAFTGTWASTSTGGPSVQIENHGGAVNGVHFSNHRSFNYSGVSAIIDISAGIDVTFDGGEICGHYPSRGIYIHGNAGTLPASPSQIAVRGVTIGGCDLGVSSLATGIDITPGIDAFTGIFTGNNLVYDDLAIFFAPLSPLTIGLVMKDNMGVDNIQQQINSASDTIVLGVFPTAKINDAAPISVINTFWSGRQVLLTSANPAGMNFVTGGNIINPVLLSVNQSVIATYIGGLGWFLK